MSEVWQVEEAKARFSEFLAAAERDGPQIVTRWGVETAILVPIAQWRNMENDPSAISNNCCLRRKLEPKI